MMQLSDPFMTTMEIWLYYVCTVMICSKILNAKYKRVRLYLSYLSFAPMMVIEPLTRDSFLYLIAVYAFLTMGIFLCRWTVKGPSVRVIFKMNAFLFLYNILLTILVNIFMSYEMMLLTEVIVHLITFVFVVIVCFTGIRKKIRMVIRYTSRKITSLILILMLMNGMMGTLILAEPIYTEYPQARILFKSLFLVLTLLLVVFAAVLLMYSITNKIIRSKAESYEKQIAFQYEYYRQISESYLALRRFRHDFRNLQIGLKKLLAENKTEDALAMLEAMNDASRTKISYDTGSGVVDALLQMKQGAAERLNAAVVFEGAVPVNAAEPADLCIIFGNSLDNAIEACAHLDHQQKKEIRVSSQCAGGIARIEITNPVSERIEIDGIIPETTKPDAASHGLGLYSIMKIVKKYDGAMRCECSGGIFRLLIELFFYEKPDAASSPQ